MATLTASSSFLAAYPEQLGDGAEELLGVGRVDLPDIGEDRRLEERAGGGDRGAERLGVGAVLNGLPDPRGELVGGALGGQRRERPLRRSRNAAPVDSTSARATSRTS